jgi:hypothetical protein
MAITLREGLGRKLTIAEMDENFTFLSSSYVVNSITSSMTAGNADSASVAARATTLSNLATASFASLASDARTSDSASVAARATTLSNLATASFADSATTASHTSATSSFANLAGTVHDGNITNAKLANDSVIIGTTEIDLGATTATLTGLTSISAITASFVLQTFESSSTVITSGSNIFGDKANDIQQITGSLLQTGSAVVSGSLDVAVGTISGSFRGDGSNLTGISSYTVANSSNNRVLTSVDASNGNAEANLTFDGSTLTVTGLVSSTSGSIGDLTVTRITETSALIHKENVQTLGDVDSIFNLRPVSFNWKEDNREDIGLIAGEVQEHYPQLVKNDHEGNALGINYSKLTAILIKAVQDLSTRITNLENK